MPTRTELAEFAINAKHDGATHVFIARSRRDRTIYYPVSVYPGQDPREVIRTARDPLMYCLALQHMNLPLGDQLIEHRPWHPEPAPGVSVEDLTSLAPPNAADRRLDVQPPSGLVADADAQSALQLVAMAGAQSATEAGRLVPVVTVEQLEAARKNLNMAREWTFSTTNTSANYSHYEHARAQLTTLTHAAYEQGRIGPCNVRRITGLRREDVALIRPAGVASRTPPLGASAVVGY